MSLVAYHSGKRFPLRVGVATEALEVGGKMSERSTLEVEVAVEAFIDGKISEKSPVEVGVATEAFVGKRGAVPLLGEILVGAWVAGNESSEDKGFKGASSVAPARANSGVVIASPIMENFPSASKTSSPEIIRNCTASPGGNVSPMQAKWFADPFTC